MPSLQLLVLLTGAEALLVGRPPARIDARHRQPPTQCSAVASRLRLVDDSSFMEVLTGPTPVLVDFSADWCGPCRLVEPLLSELEAEECPVEGECNLRVFKATLDSAPAMKAWLLTDMGVRLAALPTCILFVNGQPVSSIVGVFNASVLREFVASARLAAVEREAAGVAGHVVSPRRQREDERGPLQLAAQWYQRTQNSVVDYLF